MSACMIMMGAPLAVAEEVSADELAEMRAMVEQLQGQVEAQSEQIEHQGEVIRDARLERAREDDSRLGASGITSFLQRLEVEGWIAGSYFWNFNNPPDALQPIGNAGISGNTYPFHSHHNSFQVDQVWFGIEHPIDEENRAGFRFDLVYGTTAATLGNSTPGRCYGFGDCTSSFYVNQAYIQYLIPFTSNGITMKAGKFGTLAGAEVAQTTANFNITRGNVYNIMQPIDHTGVLFDTEWGESGITTAFGVANSSINGFGTGADSDINKAKSIIGQIGWSNETLSATTTVLWGPDNIVNGDDKSIGLVDLVLTWDPNEKISTWLNFDYGWSKPTHDTQHGFGIALAGRYAVTERFGIASRLEWVGDKNGYAGWAGASNDGDEANIYSITGTLDYALTNNLMVRGEVRWDTIRKKKSNDSEFFAKGFGTRRSQTTLGAELVYEF